MCMHAVNEPDDLAGRQYRSASSALTELRSSPLQRFGLSIPAGTKSIAFMLGKITSYILSVTESGSFMVEMQTLDSNGPIDMRYWLQIYRYTHTARHKFFFLFFRLGRNVLSPRRMWRTICVLRGCSAQRPIYSGAERAILKTTACSVWPFIGLNHGNDHVTFDKTVYCPLTCILPR